jgi:nitroreductase
MQEILKCITDRRSLRVPFDPERKIAEEDLQKILEAARWSPTAHNMQNFEIVVVDDKENLEAIVNIERPVSETFVRENFKQLSFSEDELMHKKKGILGSMFPPSWRTSGFRLKNFSYDEIKSMQQPLPESPLMLVVVYNPKTRAPASERDFLGIISLGCTMQNMWLMANSMGIGFQIISSLSAGTVGDKLKYILKIPEDLVIAYTCRLGYPKGAIPKFVRVRRDIEDFVHYNNW